MCCSLVCGLPLPWLNEMLIPAFELKSRHFVLTKAIPLDASGDSEAILEAFERCTSLHTVYYHDYVKISTYDVRRPISEDGLGELQSLKT